jgi:hypothetical protein
MGILLSPILSQSLSSLLHFFVKPIFSLNFLLSAFAFEFAAVCFLRRFRGIPID